MTLKDDEDLFLSPSGQDAFVSREKAEQKAKESKAQQKGKLLELQKQILSGQIDAAQADEETKRMQKKSDDEPETFCTKTLKESESEDVLNAQTEFTTDDFVQKSHKETKRKEQEEQEISNEDV